jgi:RHS repeat-associated protein
VYDGGNVIEERTSTGGSVKYVHGTSVDEVLAQQSGSTVSYYVGDHLGSVLQQTDASGAVTLTREYDPFGNPIQGEGQSGYAFTGREWDAEIGAAYYRARFYDPKLGRFISEDPLGPARRALRERNGYSYVANDPADHVDPTGMVIWKCRRPSDFGTGWHFFLYDPKSKANCGRGSESNKEYQNGKWKKAGVQCQVVPGSEGKEADIMTCCSKRRASGTTVWVTTWPQGPHEEHIPEETAWPMYETCLTVVDDCLKGPGVKSPDMGGTVFPKGKCSPCQTNPNP